MNNHNHNRNKKPNPWELQILIMAGCIFGIVLSLGESLVFANNAAAKPLHDLIALFAVALLSAVTALIGVREWFYGSKMLAYMDWSIAVLGILFKAYRVTAGV